MTATALHRRGAFTVNATVAHNTTKPLKKDLNIEQEKPHFFSFFFRENNQT